MTAAASGVNSNQETLTCFVCNKFLSETTDKIILVFKDRPDSFVHLKCLGLNDELLKKIQAHAAIPIVSEDEHENAASSCTARVCGAIRASSVYAAFKRMHPTLQSILIVGAAALTKYQISKEN